MISENEARTLIKQNHPVLAGYLFDGEVSELDLLAGLFKLIEDRIITPVFEEGDIRNKLISLKLANRNVESKFDQIIIESFFPDTEEITTKEAGEKIKDEGFKLSMNLAFEIISGIKVDSIKYQQKLGNTYVDVVSKAGVIRDQKSLKEHLKSSIVGILTLIIIVVFQIIDIHSDRFINVSYGFIFSLLVVGLMIYSVFFTRYYIKVNLSDDKVVKQARQKYHNLYDFLNKYPLTPHTFTNEFLPFSIAFGLDQSWNKDFGLDNFTKLYLK